MRALNSYIAFRSYYQEIFSYLEQSDASTLLSQLWKLETNVSAWALMAKAYSVIRDYQGKGNSPLGTFLQIVGPKLAIVKPANYLEAFGWQLSFGRTGASLVHDPSSASAMLGAPDGAIAMSVRDLIQECVYFGYVSDSILKTLKDDLLVVKQSAYLGLKNLNHNLLSWKTEIEDPNMLFLVGNVVSDSRELLDTRTKVSEETIEWDIAAKFGNDKAVKSKTAISGYTAGSFWDIFDPKGTVGEIDWDFANHDFADQDFVTQVGG